MINHPLAAGFDSQRLLFKVWLMKKTLLLIVRVLSRLSVILGYSARPVLAVLVVCMLYEVFSRYFLSQPTKWAFDVSYMLNGTIFVLGAGYALYNDDHVKIDFLANRLPVKVKAAVDLILYGFLFSPLILGIAWIATQRAYRAFERGEVEAVSPWAPLMWPFYSVISLGLLVLFLQCIAVTAKKIILINDWEAHKE